MGAGSVVGSRASEGFSTETVTSVFWVVSASSRSNLVEHRRTDDRVDCIPAIGAGEGGRRPALVDRVDGRGHRPFARQPWPSPLWSRRYGPLLLPRLQSFSETSCTSPSRCLGSG